MRKRELDDGKGAKQCRVVVRVSPEEKQLMELKKDEYGYMFLSDYIRDACIYENLFKIDISYADAVNDLLEQYIVETRKFTKEARQILKYNTSMSDEEKENLQHLLYMVYSQTKALKKSVNDNIDISAIKVQAKERLYQQEINKLQKEYENAIH